MRRLLCFLLLLSVLQSAIPSPLHPQLVCTEDAGGISLRHVHLDGNAASSHYGHHHRHHHGHRHGHTHGNRNRAECAGADSITCNCLKSSHEHDADAAWLPDLTVDVRRGLQDFAVARSVLTEDVPVSQPAEYTDAFPADDRGSSWHSSLPLCLRI
jgi:hypothetical protein